MFDKINGLPAHPLIVHVAVAFIPLLCLAALAYALIPKVRSATWWAATALGVAGPLAAFLATNSGENLAESRYQDQLPERTHDHEEFGEATLYTSLALGLATLVLVYLTRTASGQRLPSWLRVAVMVATVALSVVTGYYVVRTGDSGAQSVWGS